MDEYRKLILGALNRGDTAVYRLYWTTCLEGISKHLAGGSWTSWLMIDVDKNYICRYSAGLRFYLVALNVNCYNTNM